MAEGDAATDWTERFPADARHRPANVAEVEELVKRAASRRTPIFPVGGLTGVDIGLLPDQPGILVDLRSLDRVIDYPSEDMTITVELGMTVQRLMEILATKNQFLPIDVPLAAQCTIGGAIARNASGPRTFGYGTLRDYLLGIDFIDPFGRRVHGGGRVVKNVAGYDLMKLQIGAMGTLGILVEATLKVLPLPKSKAIVVLSVNRDELDPFLARLNLSQTRPVAIEVLNREFAQLFREQLRLTELHDSFRTVVLFFEESAQGVDWQVQTLLADAGNAKLVANRLSDEAIPRALLAMTDWPFSPRERFSWKAQVLPSEVASFMAEAEFQLPHAKILAHAGTGTVIGAATCASFTQANEIITSLRKFAIAKAGSLTVWHCPAEWKTQSFVFGTETQQWTYSRMLKQQLDPQALFSPGRFL